MISELVDLMIYLIISRVLLDFETVFQLYTDREKQRGRDRQREIERQRERETERKTHSQIGVKSFA